MTQQPLQRRSVVLALLLATLATPVLAHHGWAWTESGFFELTGEIRAIYLGNPHATVDVDVDGTIWRVELAPPGRTAAAGFVEGAVSVGDEIVAIGNRSADTGETRMKAVRLIVGGETYDVYPERAADI
jgi:hypothetical protein